MSYQFRHLNPTDQPVVYATFREAFADYIVSIDYLTADILMNRFTKNQVKYEYSVGAFHGEDIVGVCMFGLGVFEGEKSAFNALTGIVAEHRGKQLIKKMFDFALPTLQAEGITQLILEVIQSNEPAIKAYQKIGFEIHREWDCWEKPLTQTFEFEDIPTNILVRRMLLDELVNVEDFSDWTPSWENNAAALQHIPDEFWLFGAFRHRTLVGYLAYYPAMSQILQIGVLPEYRHQGIASYLIKVLQYRLPSNQTILKLYNQLAGDEGVKAFVLSNDFEWKIGLYEMRMKLS
jgi:ribosomal protein S18 acetylase RimI-like enzyme